MAVTRCPFDHPLISAFESGRGGLYNSINSFSPSSSYGFTPSVDDTNYLPTSTFTDSYVGDGHRRGDTDISYYDGGKEKIESVGEAGSFDGAMEGYGGGGGAFGGGGGGLRYPDGGLPTPDGRK